MNDNGRNSNNPMLRKSVISKVSNQNGEAMTRNGAYLKTFILFLIFAAGVAVSWTGSIPALYSYAGWVSLMIIGTVLSFVTAFVPKVSPITSPFYALAEGLLLGSITLIFSTVYHGIVVQALLITTGIFFVTLIFYRTGLITVTNRFRMGIFTATMGIAFVYLADIVLSFFGAQVPFLHDNSLIGIGISLIIVIIASLNFMIDFDYIDRCSTMGAPKYMEWYLGYSIMVTFVWLYLEVLRLLSRIQGSSR